MRRSLPLIAAALVVGLSGYAHGLRTGRWVTDRQVRDAVARVDRVPMGFGDWSGRPGKLDRATLDAAGVAGGLVRRYDNRRGEAVSVMLLCGRSGPVSVHPPEVCYQGSG